MKQEAKLQETKFQDLELLLKRTAFKKDYTIGNLGYIGYDKHNNVIDKVPFLCNTLEPSKASKEMIPKGKYKVISNLSYKFNRELPLLLDVQNRMAIRIHRGNSARDTQGCILVGINDRAGWIRNSAKYEQKIVELVKQYKECWVTIG
jgi:hypothetical protein